MKLPADFDDFRKDTRFLELVKHVLNSEGGYVNHPSDPGGPTFRGIAYNYNVLILRELGISDVREVTKDIAMYIYYRKYWKAALCHMIASDRIAYIHFDCAVNCGLGAAANCIIKLSKNYKFFEAEGKNVDLWWRLFVEYIVARTQYYVRCKNRKPFIDGWMNRLSHVSLQCLALPD